MASTDQPYDWSKDGDFAVETNERPDVYQDISEAKRRELWNSQSRAIIDQAIVLVHAGDGDGAVDLIHVFVTRFNRRYGAVHTTTELTEGLK